MLVGCASCGRNLMARTIVGEHLYDWRSGIIVRNYIEETIV